MNLATQSIRRIQAEQNDNKWFPILFAFHLGAISYLGVFSFIAMRNIVYREFNITLLGQTFSYYSPGLFLFLRWTFCILVTLGAIYLVIYVITGWIELYRHLTKTKAVPT